MLGIWLIQQHPDLYYAYIGNAQMVNTTENDIMGYELALQYLDEKVDTAMLETLKSYGPPPYSGNDLAEKYLAYIDVLNDYMNVPCCALMVPLVPLFAPEYGYVDKLNHTRDLIESFTVVYPQLSDLEFTTQATSLDVPVYIFLGQRDANAMTSLIHHLSSPPHP